MVGVVSPLFYLASSSCCPQKQVQLGFLDVLGFLPTEFFLCPRSLTLPGTVTCLSSPALRMGPGLPQGSVASMCPHNLCGTESSWPRMCMLVIWSSGLWPHHWSCCGQLPTFLGWSPRVPGSQPSHLK